MEEFNKSENESEDEQESEPAESESEPATEESNDFGNESEEPTETESNKFESDEDSRDMHKAKCSECGKDCEVPFEPTEGKPVYCKECYAERRPKRRFNNRGPRDDFRQREMHKAKCSECGKNCEVPFRPTEGKPVYCKECYADRRD